MKVRWISILLAVIVSAAWVSAQSEEESGVTVITSDRLTFDYNKQFALFEGHVVVTDPEMNLKADTMTVRFTEGNEVETIDAEGHVQITQLDKVAESGKATYDVSTGKITLVDQPTVRRGKDLLEGEKIIFWRDENKMICEPRARLVIFPSEGGTRDQLMFGE